MSTRKANGVDPQLQKILKELDSPELKAILNTGRPIPPNRAAARAAGLQSREAALKAMEVRQKRLERFRARTCDKWFAETLAKTLRAPLFKLVSQKKWAARLCGIRLSMQHGSEFKKGRQLPSTLLSAKVLWFIPIGKQLFIWEID